MTPIPKSITRAAEAAPWPYGLLLFIDAHAYLELTALSPTAYQTQLKAWRKDTLPTLARSDVRYFIKTRHELHETKRP